jgi:hypothetical protein
MKILISILACGCFAACTSGMVCLEGVECGDVCCEPGQECVAGQCSVAGCQNGQVSCGDICCEVGQDCINGSCTTTLGTVIVNVAHAADVLFLIDNSASMVGEQRQLGESFALLADRLEDSFGLDYHIGVITTGMESMGCPPCGGPVMMSCMNETGETGRFQDRIGHNQGTIDEPDYSFRTDPACGRVISASNKNCIYDSSQDEGIALVGVNGCGYERGLAAIRIALGSLEPTYNAGFLRDEAVLMVVVVSDEDDCGEVGDITEGLAGIGGSACYYAAKGVDPDGAFNDPEGKPYHLTPVEDYYNFLMGLKNNKRGMVKFAAIVGVSDVDDPSTTTIDYFWDANMSRWNIVDACNTPGCTGHYCFASPGTRYIRLAQMFGLGQNGLVDTICQNDFSPVMQALGNFVGCPQRLVLSRPPADYERLMLLLNGTPVSRYSCNQGEEFEECTGPGGSCTVGDCVETWVWEPPDQSAPGGTIVLADHYDPCKEIASGTEIRFSIVEEGA